MGAAAARLQDHPADAWVQRQARQLAADIGQLVGVVDRAQFIQQLITVGDGAALRRLQERKLLDVAQVQRLHPQDHAGQRRAQDFRIGEARTALEILLVVEPDADAVRHPAASPGALIRRRLADRLDQHLLDLAAKAGALHARRAGVDHVARARHGQRGFRHIGRQYDAPAGVTFEDAVLLGGRKAREERQHLGIAHDRLVCEMPAQVVGRLADLAFAGQEHQDVAGVVRIAPEFVDAVGDGVVDVVLARFLVGPVPLLHRKRPAGHIDDWRRAFGRLEMLREAVGVDGRRGHDDLQVGPARQDFAQVAEQEVDVQRTLVRLVDDDRVVGLEERIGLRLGQQDAVGHQLDRRIAAQPVLEPHLEADHVAERRLEFLGDALGHRTGGDPARLRVADQLALPRRLVQLAAAQQQRDLRQLRRLSGTGFAADDHDLVGGYGFGDFFAAGGNGQRFGKFDFRERGR